MFPSSRAPLVWSSAFGSRIGWLKVVVFSVAMIPFLRLFWLGYQDDLTANPIEFVTRSTGIWTLAFLCITLAVTPVRRLTGQVWLVRLRRMLGLFAFFYACLHLTTYMWFDQWFDLSEMLKDVFKRPFITAGFAAFVLMVPLALTSNQWAMRALKRRWQQLHRLIYLIVPIGLLHFWWHKGGKNDFFEPSVYAGVVVLLLGLRLFWHRKARKAREAEQANVST